MAYMILLRPTLRGGSLEYTCDDLLSKESRVALIKQFNVQLQMLEIGGGALEGKVNIAGCVSQVGSRLQRYRFAGH